MRLGDVEAAEEKIFHYMDELKKALKKPQKVLIRN